MSITRYIYSTKQKILEYTHWGLCNRSRIFLFHQVNNDKEQWDDVNCAITADNFKLFIESLEKTGTTFGNICKLDSIVFSTQMSFVTFDDVYKDVIEFAIPILEEKNIPFCVFIAEDKINQSKYITDIQVKDLAENKLCTIGYHSKSHKMLRFINEKNILSEIEPSHVEKIIGRKIDLFAYPYGSCYAVSRKNITSLAENGQYKMAFSTLRMGIDRRILMKYPYFLPRININNNNFGKYIKHDNFKHMH